MTQATAQLPETPLSAFVRQLPDDQLRADRHAVGRMIDRATAGDPLISLYQLMYTYLFNEVERRRQAAVNRPSAVAGSTAITVHNCEECEILPSSPHPIEALPAHDQSPSQALLCAAEASPW